MYVLAFHLVISRIKRPFLSEPKLIVERELGLNTYNMADGVDFSNLEDFVIREV